jgi:hypothetical protein
MAIRRGNCELSSSPEMLASSSMPLSHMWGGQVYSLSVVLFWTASKMRPSLCCVDVKTYKRESELCHGRHEVLKASPKLEHKH